MGAGAAIAALFLALPEKTQARLPWQPFTREALEAARGLGKPVIVDAFADWCIPCKELDKITFSHPAIQNEAGRFVWLKLDLTRDEPNSEATQARDHFAIRGVPTIIFLDSSGHERTDIRVEGFEKPAPFLARMGRLAGNQKGPP